MYAWIWRKLPFGRYGKLTGSLVLLTVSVAQLWYFVFPWAEPLLPFDDVQVATTGEQGAAEQDPNVVPGADPAGLDPADPGAGEQLPYNTESNNPVPTKSATR